MVVPPPSPVGEPAATRGGGVRAREVAVVSAAARRVVEVSMGSERTSIRSGPTRTMFHAPAAVVSGGAITT